MTNYFDLDKCLVSFRDESGITEWSIRDSFNGLNIFGGIGSGKTSASGRKFAHAFLKNGYGGLVLTVKEDEKDLWVEYCKETGRANDLLIVEPNGKHYYNFLQEQSLKKLDGISITENIVQILKTVIRSSEEKSGGKSDDPFWETATDMLLFNVIDLCILAYGSATVEQLYDIVACAPKKEQINNDRANNFRKAFEAAQWNVDTKIFSIVDNLPNAQKEALKNPELFEKFILDFIPEAALLKSIDQFFIDTFRNLSEKTRSIVDFSFSGFLFKLLKEPVFSLFCKRHSSFKLEDCRQGKIILVHLPVKVYQKVGRDCQVLFKYIWQKTLASREVSDNECPLFLWADEAQHFIHEFDSEYQATARSSRIATVYLTQNIPNYHANMGGIKSDHRVKSFLGTLATKVFHANADLETNNYGSALIGDGYTEDTSNSNTMAGNFSSSQSTSYKLERMVRPEEFNTLRTGGPKNKFIVDAYVHMQGNPFHDGFNHKKISFRQTQS